MYGRITGLSGAFNSVVKYDKAAGFEWKAAFMIALMTIPALLNQIYGNVIVTKEGFTFRMFDENDEIDKRQDIAAWIIGGFLVGWGTRMGNGCTSGHGVCGLPRFAPRSIAATCTFMATGFMIATLRYYVPFLNNGPSFGADYAPVWRWVALGVLIAINLYALFLILATAGRRLELLLSYFFGLLFGLGLVISGMCRISKIQNFLIIGDVWDPSLMFVMASAVAINVVTFNYILRKVEKPVMGGTYGVPPRGVIDLRLLGGAAIFGLGWGLAGLCPGPGVICFFSMTHAIIWVAALAIGQVAYDICQKYLDDYNRIKL